MTHGDKKLMSFGLDALKIVAPRGLMFDCGVRKLTIPHAVANICKRMWHVCARAFGWASVSLLFFCAGACAYVQMNEQLTSDHQAVEGVGV